MGNRGIPDAGEDTLSPPSLSSRSAGADPGPEHDLFDLAVDRSGPGGGSDFTRRRRARVCFYMLCAAFGLTALIFAVPYAYDALRLTGAAYLLWLAWAAFRPRRSLAIRGQGPAY